MGENNVPLSAAGAEMVLDVDEVARTAFPDIFSRRPNMDKQQTYYVVVSCPFFLHGAFEVKTHNTFATRKEANALCREKNKRAREREFVVRAVKMGGEGK